MRKAGVSDYAAFARSVLERITDRPISFEVFSDEFPEMARQARKIASWGKNVYVKLPITNTRGASALETVQELAESGIKVNVTALMTLRQVRDSAQALRNGPASYISVFAGRIADTGRDPVPLMAAAVELCSLAPKAELIWASPRELLNIFHANEIGCHVITVTHDILKKLELLAKDLDQYSLETVQMFYNDAKSAGFAL
jgi:transaldolase